jgi:hypothetical protein
MTNESGSGSSSCFSRHLTSRRRQKNFLILHFSAHYPFLKVHSHRFAEIKSHEEKSHKTVGIKVFLTVFA